MINLKQIVVEQKYSKKEKTKEKKKISKHYTVTVDKKMYNNLLDILMSKNFKVKT